MARRLIRCVALYLVLAAAVWAVVSMRLPSGVFAQEDPNRAALVVRFNDGSVETQCVSFSEPFISGAELLTRSGLEMKLDYNSGLGGAVCSIRGYGCAFPTQDCFCRCQGIRCEYWAYYHWLDGRWQYSQIGAGSHRVTNGALEGWSWGPGNFSSGTEPPQLTFDKVCASSAPAAFIPATAPTEVYPPPVGSLLTPAVRAQEIPAAHAVPAQSATSTPVYLALFPSYGAYLLFAAALVGVSVWVLERRRKATAVAASAGRRS
jgi:hypothetical protein